MTPVRFMRPALIAAALTLIPPAAQAQRFSDGYQFLKAVRDADGNKVNTFLNKPGQSIINTRDPDSGESALHIAARRSDSTYLQFLLYKGANPNIVDRRGNSPLLVAVTQNFAEGVEVLLRQGASVNLANASGETPLIRAVQDRNLELSRTLLTAGADPDKSDVAAGLSARDYAKRDARSPALTKLLADAPVVKAKAVSGPKF